MLNFLIYVWVYLATLGEQRRPPFGILADPEAGEIFERWQSDSHRDIVVCHAWLQPHTRNVSTSDKRCGRFGGAHQSIGDQRTEMQGMWPYFMLNVLSSPFLRWDFQICLTPDSMCYLLLNAWKNLFFWETYYDHYPMYGSHFIDVKVVSGTVFTLGLFFVSGFRTDSVPHAII